jgi:glycosyltransferase involved in cell wall biosynthesis
MVKDNDKIIWILSELYYPEDSATGHNITNVAEGLAESFQVKALCAQPTYQSRGLKAPKNEIHNKVLIHRCSATSLNKDILLFRLMNLITISLSIFYNALLRIREGDIVLVVTNPPTLPFVVNLVCKLRKAKLILRVEDVYPDALVSANMLSSGSVLVKIFNVLQQQLYKSVAHIIVLGRDMMWLVQSKMNYNITNITLITNFADSDQITPLPRENNPLLKKLNLLDKFVVQYSGNMGRTHGIENLFECAKILENQNSIHFLFIGFGAKEQWLKNNVKKFGLKNVTVLDLQPRGELNSSLNACDIAVISFVKGMLGVSVPCRMYNIMSAGKPILAISDKNSELALVVKEENIGWVVEPEEPALIAKAILKASSSKELLNQITLRTRSLATQKYSLSSIKQKYRDLVSCMLLNDKSGLLDKR